ncbi:MAG: hypothetical protein GQ532_09025, partial [Methylomarinum sp.]|nr:hypothetical protein [Methylomarinum sp.]
SVPNEIESQLALIIKQLELQSRLIIDLKNENKRLKAVLAKLQGGGSTITDEIPTKFNATKLLEDGKKRQEQHADINVDEQRKLAEAQLKAERLGFEKKQRALSSDRFFKVW